MRRGGLAAAKLTLDGKVASHAAPVQDGGIKGQAEAQLTNLFGGAFESPTCINIHRKPEAVFFPMSVKRRNISKPVMTNAFTSLPSWCHVMEVLQNFAGSLAKK